MDWDDHFTWPVGIWQLSLPCHDARHQNGHPTPYRMERSHWIRCGTAYSVWRWKKIRENTDACLTIHPRLRSDQTLRKRQIRSISSHDLHKSLFESRAHLCVLHTETRGWPFYARPQTTLHRRTTCHLKSSATTIVWSEVSQVFSPSPEPVSYLKIRR